MRFASHCPQQVIKLRVFPSNSSPSSLLSGLGHGAGNKEGAEEGDLNGSEERKEGREGKKTKKKYHCFYPKKCNKILLLFFSFRFQESIRGSSISLADEQARKV